MPRLTDLALITQVVAFGSQRAFGQLVQAHQEPVRRFLCRLTGGDTMRADDLAQDTFIRAWQGLSGFRQMSGFETWLFSIAYRVFLDDERKEKRRLDAPLDLPVREGAVAYDTDQIQPANLAAPSLTGRVGGEADSDSFTLRHDLDQAFATLSETERTCVVLQAVEGQSIKEIAVITGLNENTVKSHLLRGKKNLAQYLRNNGYHG